MIKHTIKVPALGIEIDGSKVDSIEVGDREDYTDYRYYEINEPVSSRPTVIIKFKSGGKLDLSDVEFTGHLYSMENIVDFELGATYIVSSRYQEWAAVCLQNKTGD